MQAVPMSGISSPKPSKALLLMIEKVAKPHLIKNPRAQAITLNFKDPGYGPEQGGFHPVEIRMERQGDAYVVSYITDFAYVGLGDCAELAKALDFDWGQDCFEAHGFPPQPLKDGKDLYPIFEANFLSYHQNGVFEVSVSLD